MNCHMLLLTDEACKAEDLQKSFEFYVEHFPRFSQRVIVRKVLWPYWESVDKLDYSQHCFTNSTSMNHESMSDHVSNSLTQGMDPMLPLWKVTLFPNYTLDDGTSGSAILLKFHHCMGDGFSMASTIMSGVEKPPVAPAKPPAPKGAHKPGQVGSFFGAAAKLLTTQDDPPSAIKADTLLKARDDRLAVWVTAKTTVEDVKRVAKVHGFTINDVVLAAISATLRKYAILKGQTPVDPLSLIWVALRPIAEALEVNDPSDVENPTNSTLGAFLLRLPVSQAATGIERVRAVADLVEQMKGSPEPFLAQKINGMFGLMPKQFTNQIWDLLANKVSISVSNVPGPKFEMKWAGVTIKDVQIWVPPVGTISTFALVTSFRNRISLSLGLDAAIFTKDDGAFITSTFDQEMSVIMGSMPSSRL